MAKTNAKIPSFHRNVNEPLMRKANRISVDSSKIGAHKWHWVTRSVTRLGNFLDFGQLFSGHTSLHPLMKIHQMELLNNVQTKKVFVK